MPIASTRHAVAAAALSVVACCTSTAPGQGTSRHFADPLSFDDMRALLTPLQLSAGQHEVADAAHAQYLETLLELRHGRISAYLERYGARPLAFMDERDDIVAAGRERRSIDAAIVEAERRLFTALEPALTEAQRTLVPRLADRRERQRIAQDVHTPVLGWSLPRLSRLDLARYLDDLDLEPAVRERIDPALATYEASLTPLFRKVEQRRHALPLAHFDRTWEARRAVEEKLAELEGSDAASDEAYSRAVGEALHGGAAATSQIDEIEQIRDEVVRISRLNRDLLDELRPRLGVDAAHRLEQRYVRRALPGVGVPRDPLARRVEAFLSSDGDAEVKAAVETLYEGYLTARQPRIWRLIAEAEEAAFRRRLRQQPDGEPPSDLEKARSAVRQLDRDTLQQYAAMTGEAIEDPSSSGVASTFEWGAIEGGGATFEIEGDAGPAVLSVVADASVVVDGGDEASAAITIELFTPDAGEGGGELSAVLLPAVGEGMVGSGEPIVLHAMTTVRGSSRGWLPGAIRREDVDRLAADLGLDEPMAAVLDSLYEDYLSSFHDLEREIVDPARLTLDQPMQADDVDDAYGGIRAAMESILAVDRRFLDDVWAIRGAAGEPAIARAMRARQRWAYGHVGRGPLFTLAPVASREPETDLLAVARDAVDDLDESAEPLVAHDLASVPLVTQRWHARLDEAAEAARKRAADKEAAGPWVSTVVGPPMLGNGPSALEKQLGRLNRSTLDALAEVLDPVSWHAIREAYQRQAFPSAYRDPDDLEPLLARARALDLPPAPRDRLDRISLEHRGAYAAICDRMIETIRRFEGEAAARTVTGPERFEHREQLNQELGALRFERKNLNQRTRQSLIDLLDERSRAELGLAGGS